MGTGSGVTPTTVTIANGAAVSSAVRMDNRRLTGFITPATLTNTAFDVQYSNDNGTTWYDISSLSAISAPVSTLVSLNPADCVNAHYVRLQGSGNEGGARTIILLSQPLT